MQYTGNTVPARQQVLYSPATARVSVCLCVRTKTEKLETTEQKLM